MTNTIKKIVAPTLIRRVVRHLVEADVEGLKQVGRCFNADAVRESFGSHRGVAAVHVRRWRNAPPLDVLVESKELIRRTKHCLDQRGINTVTDELEEANLSACAVNRTSDGLTNRSIAMIPVGNIDDRHKRFVHHHSVPVTQLGAGDDGRPGSTRCAVEPNGRPSPSRGKETSIQCSSKSSGLTSPIGSGSKHQLCGSFTRYPTPRSVEMNPAALSPSSIPDSPNLRRKLAIWTSSVFVEPNQFSSHTRLISCDAIVLGFEHPNERRRDTCVIFDQEDQVRCRWFGSRRIHASTRKKAPCDHARRLRANGR